MRVSNLDKVLYPAAGTTKADLLRYYLEISEFMLPHLAGRPVTMRRYPDGVAEEGFYQKRCPDHHPDWMGTITLGRPGKDTEVEHCDLADRAALAWVANLGALELHVPMGRSPNPLQPVSVVFDLDPGAPADILDCAWLALRIHDLLEELGLECFVKTSGSKGLQVYLPIAKGSAHYDDSREFAQAIARGLERQHPDRVVSEQAKKLRTGKILIDWTQNHAIKTTVCVYSPRARERPTVSTPLDWAEVADALDQNDANRLIFEMSDVLDRVQTDGDRFADVLEGTQTLPNVRA